MGGCRILLAALAINACAGAAFAENIRLAQSSAVTTCMMSCNAQAAACQSNCVVPGTPPTNAATTTSNAATSTLCILNCNSAQLTCQTSCARQSPSP